MKVYCPKCHTCYSVEIGLIPVDGKRFRCTRCGEIWTCTHKDFNVTDSPKLQDEPSQPQNQTPSDSTSSPQNVIANEQNEILSTPAPQENTESQAEPAVNEDEMSVIFARLKDESSRINTEFEQLSPLKKNLPKIKKLLGWDNRFTITLELLTVAIIIALSLFAGRYELVRRFPQAEQVYSGFGVPSRVIGEGLEFQNITRHYADNDNGNQLNIKGFINNTTDERMAIPTVVINILDENTNSIKQIKQEVEAQTIEAHAKIPFTLLVDIPPQQAKYILLTFGE